MNTTPLPLASLIATARQHETQARTGDRDDHFAMQLAAAFPSLYQHPALHDSDCMTAIIRQWSFTLDGVEFLVRWVPGVRGGGYWTFQAWDDGTGTHTARDTASYYTPNPDTALTCFIGEALDAAAAVTSVVMEVSAVA